MKSFNVFGCCVSRDSLNILEAQEKAVVLQCAGGTTTISAFSNKLSASHTYTIDDFEKYEGSHFFKRLACQDINKTAMDYLFEKKSDFLLIDLQLNRLNMFRKDDIYITNTLIYSLNKEKFAKDFKLEEYEEIKASEQTMELYVDSLDKLCNIVLKNYSPDQIILNEYYQVLSYSKDMRRKLFDATVRSCSEACNKLVKEMFAYVKSKIKGCHRIPFIENTFADPSNKWGLHPLHYHSLYYEYNAKAIEIVSGGASYEEEIVQLKKLCKQYSEKFEILNLKLDMMEKNDSLRWTANAAKFEKNLLIDMLSDKKFINNLLKIKEIGLTVAVLKCNDNAGEILLKALEAYKIKVVFKTCLWEFQWLKTEEFEKCRSANLIISANVHETKAPEKDGIRAILISDLLKEKMDFDHQVS